MVNPYRALALSTLCCLVGTTLACARPDAAGIQQPRAFVQDFYDWYVPLADSSPLRSRVLATERMRTAVAPDLLAPLTAVVEAAERETLGAITGGLDFDPFLNAQDPCERYEVSRVLLMDQRYWVDIHGVGGCREHDDADLVAEVRARAGGWEFVNFHYRTTPRDDLLQVLERARVDKRGISARPPDAT